jgi:hypothetical protein
VEDEPESYEEVRDFLESIGFLAGYAGEWEQQLGVNDTSGLDVGFYLFSVPEGAAAYLEYAVARMESMIDPEVTEPITVGDIPGSRAWTGNGPSATVIFFTKGNFAAYVACTGTAHESGGMHRRLAVEFAKRQYGLLSLDQ